LREIAKFDSILRRTGIASLTIAEIRRGILEKPAGRKRDQLDAWFSSPEGPPALFAGRVLPFDEKAGLIWGRLMAERSAKGTPRSALDAIVAAVAEANGCIVVTDNEKDFADIEARISRGLGGGQPCISGSDWPVCWQRR
jgi:hypothetical protein